MALSGTEYTRDVMRRLQGAAGTEAHLGALTTMVLELLAEVEALRSTVATSPALTAHYRQHYERTALLAHNAAGPMGGQTRLLMALFGSGPAPELAFGGLEDSVRREVNMLERLGASPAEVTAHLAEVEAHATRT